MKKIFRNMFSQQQKYISNSTKISEENVENEYMDIDKPITIPGDYFHTTWGNENVLQLIAFTVHL